MWPWNGSGSGTTLWRSLMYLEKNKKDIKIRISEYLSEQYYAHGLNIENSNFNFERTNTTYKKGIIMLYDIE